MKRILFVVMLLLLVVACKPKNELQAVVLEDGKDLTDTAVEDKVEEQDETTKDAADTEENKEEFKDVTEIKTYDTKGECTKDSQGVVRYFDENGKKTVYRNECSFGFLVVYDCEGNEVTSETKTCTGTCVQGIYGDTCE